MALESYRRQRIISNSANADFNQIIMLNAGDVDGRIVRFEAAKGNGRAATACKLWIDKGEGLAVFCELIRVDMPTPTWEAAIPVRGLDVGTYNAAIRLEDVDGSITETMPLRVQVVGSILAESEATEEMQDALDDFEIRTNAALADIAEAITDAEAATTDAQTATTEATEAAQAANTAAQNIGASVDAQGILTVTDADGTVTTYDGAATAAQSATSAANRANAAAVSAETAAGNIGAEVDSSGIVTVTDADGTQTEFSGLADAVLLARGAAERADDAAVNANAAKTAANSAALAANSAATSATSAAGTATGAAETATSAAGSASTAATNATSAANAANSAATSANSAATSATSAATTATNAANTANTAAGNAATATTNANSATTAANDAATSASDAATAANAAADDATDAATEARNAAAAALASIGNILHGSMGGTGIQTTDDAYAPRDVLGITVDGKSEQVTLSGKNLFDIGDSVDDYYQTSNVASIGDGKLSVIIRESGLTYAISKFQLKNFGSNALSCKASYTDTGYAGVRLLLKLRNSDNTGWLTNDDASISGWKWGSYFSAWYKDIASTSLSVSVTIPECLYWCIGFGLNTYGGTIPTGAVIEFSEVQIEAGSTATPYEPYCGGIPSPNPDYPQAIRSVAGCIQHIDTANLMPKMVPGTYTNNGITVKVDSNNVASVSGELTAASAYMSIPLESSDKIIPPDVYLHMRNDKVYNSISFTVGNTSPVFSALNRMVGLSVRRSLGNSVKLYVGQQGTINFTFQPSIEATNAATDYQPYLGTTTPLIPEGTAPLRSLPNGVCDELVVHEDGSREIVRRVGVVDLSQKNPTSYTVDGSLGAAFYSALDGSMFRANGYCTHAVVSTTGSRDAGTITVGVSNSAVYMPKIVDYLGLSSMDDFKSWLQSEAPIYLYYPSASPTTETLPSITLPAIPSTDVTAWTDCTADDAQPIAGGAWELGYERDLDVVIGQLEQAIADI